MWVGLSYMPIKPNQKIRIVGAKTYEMKSCEGAGCGKTFTPERPNARRCNECREQNRPYKTADSPF